MGILDAIIGKREPAVAYRTIDGGHPAPYPDMTDEQLYNYEMTFNVPSRTFDRPPRSRAAGLRAEPELDAVTETVPRAARPGARRYSAAPRPEAEEQELETEAEREQERARAERAAYLEREERERQEWRERQRMDQTGEWAKPASPLPTDLPPLDLGRPVRTVTTRHPVEIITARARHPLYKVHAYIGDDDVVTVFTLDGRLSENGPRFLENVPQKQQLYLNLYPNPKPTAAERYLVTQHDSREAADAAARPGRIACVATEFDL